MDTHNKNETSVELRILSGVQSGTHFTIEAPGIYRIGRDPECELTIDDFQVSRIHAAVTWDGGELVLRDNDSSNGLYVEGERVQDRALVHGDVIGVGPVVLRVVFHAPQQKRDTPLDIDATIQNDELFRSLFETMLAIQRIVSEGSPDLVRECLRTLFVALPVTRLSLLKVMEQGEVKPWYTTTVSGTSEDYLMSRTFARKVIEAQEGILIEDAQDLDIEDWGSTLQSQSVRSILGIPVKHKDTIYAVLLCDNIEKPHALSRTHLRTLGFFAEALKSVFQHEELKRLQETQARNEFDFLAAGRVQNQIFTRRPNLPMGGAQWGLYLKPALEVGGDFYDFARGDNHVTWIVADVSGKGIPAALVVSMLKGLCTMLLPQNMSPRGIALSLNRLLYGELPAELFVTALICRLSDDGTLTACSAGHPPAYLIKPIRGAKREIERLKIPGAPLGITESSRFEKTLNEGVFHMNPQDLLCLYTDGVTEAFDPHGEPFRESRLAALLECAPELGAQGLVDLVVDTVKSWRGEAIQSDDITVVAARFGS